MNYNDKLTRLETLVNWTFQYKHQTLPNNLPLFNIIFTVCIKLTRSKVLLFKCTLVITYNQKTQVTSGYTLEKNIISEDQK